MQKFKCNNGKYANIEFNMFFQAGLYQGLDGHILKMWLFSCMSKNSEPKKRKHEFRGKSALKTLWSLTIEQAGWRFGDRTDGKQTCAQRKMFSGIKNGSRNRVKYMVTSCLVIIPNELSIIKRKSSLSEY